MENKVEHLKMIQEIIGRMAKNSFSVKSWNLTLVSGLIVYTLNENVTINHFAVISLVSAIVVVFCCLDAYYLMIEKSYRKYYSFVAAKKDGDIDFLMEFPPKDKENKKFLVSFWEPFRSPSIWLYYSFILLIPIILLLLI